MCQVGDFKAVGHFEIDGQNYDSQDCTSISRGKIYLSYIELD